MKIVITGAGGFIGSHLAKKLSLEGHEIIGVDLKEPEPFSIWSNTQFFSNFYKRDLTDKISTMNLFEFLSTDRKIDRVYHLAANMGGIGFIERNKGIIVRDNTYINLNTIEASLKCNVGRFLFTSSACVYPGYLQKKTDVTPLKEDDTYPADAEDGYGWEKLYMERICRHYREDFGLETRIVRFHNVFGPFGTWRGGREKAPAAICRKVAACRDGIIEIWGDGEQTRSFLYIDDCIRGLTSIMEGNYSNPLNLGQDRMVTINELVSMVETIAKKKLERRYQMDAPQGVRGRNSDNSLITTTTGWSPQISLEEGLSKTYEFVLREVERSLKEEPSSLSP